MSKKRVKNGRGGDRKSSKSLCVLFKCPLNNRSHCFEKLQYSICQETLFWLSEKSSISDIKTCEIRYFYELSEWAYSLVQFLYQMLPLNHKKTTSFLAPPIFYVAKHQQLKERRIPLTTKQTLIEFSADVLQGRHRGEAVDGHQLVSQFPRLLRRKFTVSGMIVN